MLITPLKTVSLLLTLDPFGPLDPGSPVFPCLKEDRQEKNGREMGVWRKKKLVMTTHSMKQQKHFVLYDQDNETVKALSLIATRVIYSLTAACKGHGSNPSK